MYTIKSDQKKSGKVFAVILVLIAIIVVLFFLIKTEYKKTSNSLSNEEKQLLIDQVNSYSFIGPSNMSSVEKLRILNELNQENTGYISITNTQKQQMINGILR